MKLRKNTVLHHQPKARLEIRQSKDWKNDFILEIKGLKAANIPAKEN